MLGRLKNTYDSCQLTLIGGDFHGQKAKARHFNTSLPLLTEHEITYPSAFNIELPQVMGRMLLVGVPVLQKESYIDGLGGKDFQNIPEIAVQVALGRVPLTIIRLVYGATTELPLRALSYLLPALVYMEQNKEVVSQLQVIFVNNISSRLDRMDGQKAAEQSKAFAAVARTYIRNFFPNSDSKTVFLEDIPLDKNSDLRKRLIALTTSLKRIAPEDILDDLVRKAVNNGAGRTHAFYGAAHVLIHDIDIPGSLVPLLPDQPEMVTDPDLIVSIGGRKEEVFYRLRHGLKPYLDPEYNQVRTLQFFTRHHVPPYYMARGGDIALRDVLNGSGSFAGNGIAPAARHDIDYLCSISRNKGDLYEFFKSFGGSHP